MINVKEEKLQNYKITDGKNKIIAVQPDFEGSLNLLRLMYSGFSFRYGKINAQLSSLRSRISNGESVSAIK